jgi:PKD repeat protein
MNMKLITIGFILVFLIVCLSGCNEQEETGENTNNFEPVASCSASTESGVCPLTVQFTGSGTDADGTIDSYYWDFQDGHTSNQQNPSHTFEEPGNYYVSLQVTDDDGSTDYDSVYINVEITNRPSVSASSDIITGEYPLTVQFTGSGTDIDGSIVSYHWDFGDGKTSNEQNPSHTFSSTGSFTVKLTVEDDENATNSDRIVITVTESTESYKSSCRDDITFQQLDSNAYNYEGQKVTYQGTVVQVVNQYQFRIDVGSSDIIYVISDDYTSLVQDDLVQFWGKVNGYKTYESTAGYQITIPEVSAKYIEKVSLNLNEGEKLTISGFEISLSHKKTVNSYSYRSSYSDYIYTKDASPGYKFVFIEVNAKNVIEEKVNVPCSYDFSLITEGKQYSAESYLGDDDYRDNCGDIYPGVTAEGSLVFEVPDSASNAIVAVEVTYDIDATWSMDI